LRPVVGTTYTPLSTGRRCLPPPQHRYLWCANRHSLLSWTSFRDTWLQLNRHLCKTGLLMTQLAIVIMGNFVKNKPIIEYTKNSPNRKWNQLRTCSIFLFLTRVFPQEHSRWLFESHTNNPYRSAMRQVSYTTADTTGDFAWTPCAPRLGLMRRQTLQQLDLTIAPASLNDVKLHQLQTILLLEPISWTAVVVKFISATYLVGTIVLTFENRRTHYHTNIFLIVNPVTKRLDVSPRVLTKSSGKLACKQYVS